MIKHGVMENCIIFLTFFKPFDAWFLKENNILHFSLIFEMSDDILLL